MKKFLIDLGVVFTLIMIVNGFVYVFITNELLYKDYEIDIDTVSKSDCSTFIFSDSHGWSLTEDSPDIFQKLQKNGIFNFSYGSDSYGDMLIKFKWLLENNIEVDKIVLTVDDHMLSKPSSNKNRTIYYANGKGWSDVYRESRLKFYYYQLVHYLPLFYPSNQQLILKYLKSLWYPSNPDVHEVEQWEQISDANRLEQIERRFEGFFQKMEFVPKRNLQRNLEEILRLAKNNGVTVVGIQFPLDQVMLDQYEKYKVIDHVSTIAQDDGMDTLLDYRNQFESMKLFSNMDHINSLGAEKLSDRLINDLSSK